MKIKNAWLHFKKICKHKFYVGKYCWKLGLIKQGILHDMSKFSPVEFFESVKYYDGKRSPIDVCKEKNGYSKAWLHHKGRNPHHYEYWMDNLDKGGEPLIMPKEYLFELICDYIGAGKAYWGKEFTYEKEYEWWKNKIQNPLASHSINISFVTIVLYKLTRYPEGAVLNKESVNYIYDMVVKYWNNENIDTGELNENILH